jgi:hypothetical protein
MFLISVLFIFITATAQIRLVRYYRAIGVLLFPARAACVNAAAAFMLSSLAAYFVPAWIHQEKVLDGRGVKALFINQILDKAKP